MLDNNNQTSTRNQTNYSSLVDPCTIIASGNTIWQSLTFYTTLISNVCFAFGLFGNFLSFLAFLKQLKKVKLYYLQMSIIFLDILAIFVSLVADFGYAYLGVWALSPPKIISTTFLLPVFVISCVFKFTSPIASLILCLGVVADRLWALDKPLQYKIANHKKRAITLLGFSMVMSVAINHDLWVSSVYWVEWDETKQEYWVAYNSQLSPGLLTYMSVVGLIRTVLTLVVLVTLFIFVRLLVKKYQKVQELNKSMAKPSKIGENRSSSVDEQSLKALLLAQSLLVTLGVATNVLYNTVQIVFKVPWCFPTMYIFEYLQTICTGVQVSLNFLIYVGVSKTFRGAVIAVLKRTDLPAEQFTRQRTQGTNRQMTSNKL